jgi:CcmE
MLVLACGTDAPKPGSKETARWVNQLAASDHGELLRVAGTIAEPIERIGDVVIFQVVHSGVQLHVVHRGVLPVRFRVGSEAAVVGRWLTGDQARRELSDHGVGSAIAGDVFIASDVLAYGPQF